MSEAKIKKRKTIDLRLTKFELLHIRDLFSVLLPPDAKKTMSQALAELEERPLVEAMLWQKIHNLCATSGLPVGDDAPDYVVAPASPPPISVFQLSSEPSSEDEDDAEDDDDEEDEDSDEEE